MLVGYNDDLIVLKAFFLNIYGAIYLPQYFIVHTVCSFIQSNVSVLPP